MSALRPPDRPPRRFWTLLAALAVAGLLAVVAAWRWAPVRPLALALAAFVPFIAASLGRKRALPASMAELAPAAGTTSDRALAQLEKVVALQRELALSDRPPHALVDPVLDRCLVVVGATGAAFIALVGEELVWRHARGTAESVLGRRHLRAGTLVAEALTAESPVTVPDTRQQSRIDPQLLARIDAGSLVFAPVVGESRALGVLAVVAREANAFDLQDVHAITLVAGSLARVLERAATAEAERVAAGTNERLAAIVEASSDALSEETADGTVLSWSPGAQALYGYTRDEMAAAGVRCLSPPGKEGEYLALLRGVSAGERPEGELELVRRRKDGSEVEVALTLAPVGFSRQGVATVAVVARDVTQRRRAERRTLQSLKEKELLLKEIHHRVKNNLQVIVSLLNLQSRRTEDPVAREVIAESQARVRSIALFHEKLYRSTDLGHVGALEYLADLVQSVVRAMGRDGIAFEVRGDDRPLGVDQAVPCGLIVNELVSNALKHAFPDGRAGRIEVTFEAKDGVGRLAVEDDGVGFSAPRAERPRSLGLELVRTLAEQLGGSLEVRDKPARFEVQFPAA